MKAQKRRNSHLQTLTAGLALAVIIISVTYVNNRLNYLESMKAESVSSNTVVSNNSNTAVAVATPLNNRWKTYNNAQFGYQLGYPSDWIVDAEKIGKDEAGNVTSVATIRSKDGTQSVSIEVNKGWTARNGAVKTVSALIDGKKQIVSLFPNRADCKVGEDCSMQTVTIKKGDYWYSLVGRGNAKSYGGTYKDIFSSFQFTK